MELFNADHPGDSPRWGMALFSHWYQVREWKPSFESTLKDLVMRLLLIHTLKSLAHATHFAGSKQQLVSCAENSRSLYPSIT
jgi:hypothetical protein